MMKNCSVCGKEHCIDKGACDEIYGTVMISDFNKQMFNKKTTRMLLCRSCILKLERAIYNIKNDLEQKKREEASASSTEVA